LGCSFYSGGCRSNGNRNIDKYVIIWLRNGSLILNMKQYIKEHL
jgi:hypothetical protein